MHAVLLELEKNEIAKRDDEIADEIDKSHGDSTTMNGKNYFYNIDNRNFHT
jgi:hypothetical protein